MEANVKNLGSQGEHLSMWKGYKRVGQKPAKNMILVNGHWQDPQSKACIGLQGGCLGLADGQTRRDGHSLEQCSALKQLEYRCL